MIPLPSLSATTVKLRNRLIQKDAITLHSHQQDWSVRFEVAESIGSVALSLRVEWGHQPMWLGFSAALLDALLRRYGNDEAMVFSKLPDELQKAVITPLISDLFNTVQQTFGGPITIIALHHQVDQPPMGIILMCTVIGTTHTHGYGVFNEAFATALLPVIEKLPDRVPNLHAVAHLPMKARFIIGYTTLPLQEARAMTTGDVLIPDHCTLHPEPRVWVQLTVQQGYWAYWQGHQLLIDDPHIQETTMTHESPLPTHLNDVTLAIIFEVGEQTLTIGELAQLQPGYTFVLDKTVAKPITLRVNGQRIGSGELVQIGDQLGVRIIELYSHNSHHE